MNEKIKQALWYQGASLGAIGLIAALVLAAANNATEAAIVRARADDLKLSLAQVLPEGFADNDLLRDSIKLAGSDGAPIEVHRARRKGRVEALIFEARGQGLCGAGRAGDGGRSRRARARRTGHPAQRDPGPRRQGRRGKDRLDPLLRRQVPAPSPPRRAGRSGRTAATSTSSPARRSRHGRWLARSRVVYNSLPRAVPRCSASRAWPQRERNDERKDAVAGDGRRALEQQRRLRPDAGHVPDDGADQQRDERAGHGLGDDRGAGRLRMRWWRASGIGSARMCASRFSSC